MKRKENKSYFLEAFGDTPQLRVLDFLIDNPIFDFPVTEISRESNISYNSLQNFLGDYIKSGILIKTRRIGKSNYYKLNLKHPFVINLMKLDWSLTKTSVLVEGREKEIKEELVKA